MRYHLKRAEKTQSVLEEEQQGLQENSGGGKTRLESQKSLGEPEATEATLTFRCTQGGDVDFIPVGFTPPSDEDARALRR